VGRKTLTQSIYLHCPSRSARGGSVRQRTPAGIPKGSTGAVCG